MTWLLDTGILLRYVLLADPACPLVRAAVRTLKQRGDRLCFVPQNLAEFWNVCTRPPAARGGYGLSTERADARARLLERTFTLLPDVGGAYFEWRRLIVDCGVSGVQVHDARLVAAMSVHGVSRILTLNPADFARYPGVTAVHPRDV